MERIDLQNGHFIQGEHLYRYGHHDRELYPNHYIVATFAGEDERNTFIEAFAAAMAPKPVPVEYTHARIREMQKTRTAASGGAVAHLGEAPKPSPTAEEQATIMAEKIADGTLTIPEAAARIQRLIDASRATTSPFLEEVEELRAKLEASAPRGLEMLRMAVEAIQAEKVDAEATGDEGDKIYNRAVDDCIFAVEQLANGQLPEATHAMPGDGKCPDCGSPTRQLNGSKGAQHGK